MAYRYCPDCDRWLETAETDLTDVGEIVCPEHRAVHGSIAPGPFPITEQQIRRENPRSMYDDLEDMVDAAHKQGLIEA